jgi:hypothetical protein
MAFLEATQDVKATGYLVLCRIFWKSMLGLDLI